MVAYPKTDEERELADALKKSEQASRAAVQTLAALVVIVGGALLAFAYWNLKGLGWYLVGVGVAVFVLVAVSGDGEEKSDGS